MYDGVRCHPSAVEESVSKLIGVTDSIATTQKLKIDALCEAIKIED
ncbi:MAG: hypothetical protein WC770_09570 [Phycisphaerae bacterium]